MSAEERPLTAFCAICRWEGATGAEAHARFLHPEIATEIVRQMDTLFIFDRAALRVSVPTEPGAPDPTCPAGCGCKWPDPEGVEEGATDADRRDCACDGPCCYDSWDEFMAATREEVSQPVPAPEPSARPVRMGKIERRPGVDLTGYGDAEPSAPCICTPDQFQGHGHGVNCPQYIPEPSARLREALDLLPHFTCIGGSMHQTPDGKWIEDSPVLRALLAATPPDPEP